MYPFSRTLCHVRRMLSWIYPCLPLTSRPVDIIVKSIVIDAGVVQEMQQIDCTHFIETRNIYLTTPDLFLYFQNYTTLKSIMEDWQYNTEIVAIV